MKHYYAIRLIARRKLMVEANLRSLQRENPPYEDYKEEAERELEDLEETFELLGGNWNEVVPGKSENNSEFAK